MAGKNKSQDDTELTALIEEYARVRIGELEYMLNHEFNNHTAIRTARGIMIELGMPIPVEMISKTQKIGPAEKYGRRTGYSAVLGARLMGENGSIYLARVKELFLPIVEERLRMRDETREWERELRLAKKEGRKPPNKALWKSQRT